MGQLLQVKAVELRLRCRVVDILKRLDGPRLIDSRTSPPAPGRTPCSAPATPFAVRDGRTSGLLSASRVNRPVGSYSSHNQANGLNRDFLNGVSITLAALLKNRILSIIDICLISAHTYGPTLPSVGERMLFVAEQMVLLRHRLRRITLRHGHRSSCMATARDE